MPDSSDKNEQASRESRQNVLLSAEISGFGGGVPTRHRVRDLSPTGVRVDSATTLKVGATILISVGVLEHVGATVVWVKGDAAGLKFAEAIHPEAARSKTLIPAKPKPAPSAPSVGERNASGTGEQQVGAGWIADLSNPYRK